MHDVTGLFNSESSQSHHTPELDQTLGATSSPCSKFCPNSKFPRRNYIKILSNFNLETSQNFQRKSIFYFRELQNHILFQIFCAREGRFWINQSLKGFEAV
jgi:hypothetical protein